MEDSNQKQLAILRRKRGVVKGSLTRLRNFVKEFDPANKPTSLLEFRQEELPRINAKFDEVQCEIELISEDADEENKERGNFERDYFELRSDIQEIIGSHKESSTIGHNVSFNASSTGRRLNLVPIPLPKFDGNIENWESFYDVFQAMVHKEEVLSVTQKMYYLRSCLTGPALDMVSSIPMTDSNYEPLLQRLRQRYDNRSLVIQAHIRALLDSPRMDTDSPRSLQRLHSHVESHVAALKALGQPISHWDAWLVTVVFRCLDKQTMQDWQLRQGSTELPEYARVEKFLADRCAALETCSHQEAYERKAFGSSSSSSEPKKPKVNVNQKKVALAAEQNKLEKCAHCAGAHRLYNCESFRNLTSKKRLSVIREAKLCFNCFSPYHIKDNCKSRYSCQTCSEKHNTLLHFESTGVPGSSQTGNHSSSGSESQAEKEQKQKSLSSLSARAAEGHVFLATAMVLVFNNHGRSHECRVILDSGSQVNFVSKRLVNLLKLPVQKTLLPVSGIGASQLNSGSSVELKVRSRVKNYDVDLTGYVLPMIVSDLAAVPMPVGGWGVPGELAGCLADPSFFKSGPIDLLIGAGMFFDLMEAERVLLGTGTLCLQDSKFGWVVTGAVNVACLVGVGEKLEVDWRALTSGDDTDYGRSSKSNQRILEENRVLKHFDEHTTRDKEGRFVVRLPVKNLGDELGDSLTAATNRFLSVERRLQRDETLKGEYTRFMEEYISLGHMREVPYEECAPNHSFYLPHHAVVKESSLTTKVRVVFDASARSSSGKSLNSILMHGPTVQNGVFEVLVRFRRHQYVITSDIEKMFRQVAVSRDDWNLQRIVWRAQPEDSLRAFYLTTVTYGMKPSSFLATRCLMALAESVSQEYPEAAEVIQKDFYMDDLMTGSETEEGCIKLQQQISAILGSAKFPLRKWCSNSVSILGCLGKQEDDPLFTLEIKDGDTIKSLGLGWMPYRDEFHFNIAMAPGHGKCTRRTLLSDLNRVFDPLGFLSPVLLKGKIFLQQVWTLKVGWDSPLPTEIAEKWESFIYELQKLKELTIPRKAKQASGCDFQIHGFSDASQEAYGACVYIRTRDENGQFYTRLLCSKTRVAPLKGSTIPRLELNGALLLSQLVERVSKAWSVDCRSCRLWTDSTIVLGWLNAQAARLKVYVSNRVEQILEITDATQWRHVSTSENPADISSRGLKPHELLEAKLWWNGPQWLSREEDSWEDSNAVSIQEDRLPEQRSMHLALVAIDPDRDILRRYSSWRRLVRAVAWLKRFIEYLRSRRSASRERFLTVQDLKSAERVLVGRAQEDAFEKDMIALEKGAGVPQKGKLKSLCPYLKDGLIVVGGRLQNADISEEQRNPIVLPADHIVTRLIFEECHRRMLHCGPQLLLAEMRRTYWPVRGRAIARSVTRRCVICARANPTFTQPVMAALPRQRAQCSRPFTVIGVDFAGPLVIRSGVRGRPGKKAWIAVFVCFSTRAVHIEAVEDLTTGTFIAAFRRFMSRRGKPNLVWSDNGTNFVGAKRELAAYVNGMDRQFAGDGIAWKFNPPSAPHFGGLWESAVRSAKYHLTRIVKGTSLTLAELQTLLCQIEACLNSRPLTPIGSDPNDLEPLTPAHFLIGGPMIFHPEPALRESEVSNLKRWKLVQCLLQTFWKRWHLEYLPQFQVRGKWTAGSRPIAIDDIVVVKEDSITPSNWKLARVVKVHPGKDGVIRVATIRTVTGSEMKRPTVKLCILPTETENTTVGNQHFQRGEDVAAALA